MSDTPNNDQQAKPLRPIPTRIKKEYSVSELHGVLDGALKDIAGDDIISVMQRDSDTKVIVRREYLFELINLCNSLLYDKIQFKTEPVRDNSKAMLERGLETLRKKQSMP